MDDFLGAGLDFLERGEGGGEGRFWGRFGEFLGIEKKMEIALKFNPNEF